VGFLREELSKAHAGNIILRGGERDRLLTFAGTRANLLFGAYLGASRVDELGLDFDGLRDEELRGAAVEDVVGAASARWEWLSARLAVTKWHPLLPVNLRRDEVMSQLIGPGVVARLTDTLRRPVTEVSAAGISL
jgi:hypothetical protein